jgi:hypothetical protein
VAGAKRLDGGESLFEIGFGFGDGLTVPKFVLNGEDEIDEFGDGLLGETPVRPTIGLVIDEVSEVAEDFGGLFGDGQILPVIETFDHIFEVVDFGFVHKHGRVLGVGLGYRVRTRSLSSVVGWAWNGSLWLQ